MKNFGRIIMVLSFLTTAVLSLSACNTVAGAGQDVRSVGQGVSNGATATKNTIQNN